MRIAILLILLSSCNIYDTYFECPPGEGVGCASVGEVMDMIVETEEGEDEFIRYRTRFLGRSQENTSGPDEKRLCLIRSEEGELVVVVEEKEEGR